MALKHKMPVLIKANNSLICYFIFVRFQNYCMMIERYVAGLRRCMALLSAFRMTSLSDYERPSAVSVQITCSVESLREAGQQDGWLY